MQRWDFDHRVALAVEVEQEEKEKENARKPGLSWLASLCTSRKQAVPRFYLEKVGEAEEQKQGMQSYALH